MSVVTINSVTPHTLDVKKLLQVMQMHIAYIFLERRTTKLPAASENFKRKYNILFRTTGIMVMISAP